MTTPTANTPEDESGSGPVTIGDRVSSEGSPGSNQAKTEPMPPSGSHDSDDAPLVPPELGDMNVGAADPQAPSHPALAVPSAQQQPAPSHEASPAGGTAQRAPGSLGSTPAGESVETDVAASAAAMEPGTAEAGTADAPGSSEEHDVVEGARTPEG